MSVLHRTADYQRLPSEVGSTHLCFMLRIAYTTLIISEKQ